MEQVKELPGWLETLWNINPGLAEKAEKDYQSLKEEIQKIKLNKINKNGRISN